MLVRAFGGPSGKVPRRAPVGALSPGHAKTAGVVEDAKSSTTPAATFLLSLSAVEDQLSSCATARRASASSTPQLISCSVRTEGDWS